MGGEKGLKAEYVQPFLSAASKVMEAELGLPVRRGELSIEKTHYTTKDVTVLIGITGDVEGTVLYGMTQKVAKQIASGMTGTCQPVFDELCESAIAELGNMISGHAAAFFESRGVRCQISPPTLIVRRGTILSSMDIHRLLIPLEMPFGEVQIAVSLRERIRMA